MFLAGYFIVHDLPPNVGFTDALKVSGAAGKLNVITTGFTEKGFDWKDRYNLVSGIIGGFFLALSYFGTDQSQVGRYLTAKNLTQSRLGLLMNGLVKVPMQFAILLLGVLLFTYYQFNTGPIFFNTAFSEKVFQTQYGDSLRQVQGRFDSLSQKQSDLTKAFVIEKENTEGGITVLQDSIAKNNKQINALRKEYKTLLKKADSSIDTNDTNYIFLRFVVDNLPKGLVGLLIAIIFLAAWGSIAAALNSLSSCTMIDFYCRFRKQHPHPEMDYFTDEKQYNLSKWFTFGWGVFCIVVAQFSTGLGSLIEAVNILGSLFYGVILGIFLVAFYMKNIRGNAVFWGSIVAEIFVVALFILDNNGTIGLGFLWLNVAGALGVVVMSWLTQKVAFRNS